MPLDLETNATLYLNAPIHTTVSPACAKKELPSLGNELPVRNVFRSFYLLAPPDSKPQETK